MLVGPLGFVIDKTQWLDRYRMVILSPPRWTGAIPKRACSAIAQS